MTNSPERNDTNTDLPAEVKYDADQIYSKATIVWGHLIDLWSLMKNYTGHLSAEELVEQFAFGKGMQKSNGASVTEKDYQHVDQLLIEIMDLIRDNYRDNATKGVDVLSQLGVKELELLKSLVEKRTNHVTTEKSKIDAMVGAVLSGNYTGQPVGPGSV